MNKLVLTLFLIFSLFEAKGGEMRKVGGVWQSFDPAVEARKEKRKLDKINKEKAIAHEKNKLGVGLRNDMQFHEDFRRKGANFTKDNEYRIIGHKMLLI